MAKSCYEYVKSFEEIDKLEPLHWITLKLHCPKLYSIFNNPAKAIIVREELQHSLCAAASTVMKSFKDIKLGYGYDQNFHFILHKDSVFYKRRGYKLLSSVSSLLTSAFVISVMEKYPHKSITPQTFDGSIYLLPTSRSLQDYLVVEQHKCHLNNLKKVTTIQLMNGGLDIAEAQTQVDNLSEGQLNELLFSKFSLNYNEQPIHMKKGLCLGHLQAAIEHLLLDFHKDDIWRRFCIPPPNEPNKHPSYIEQLKRTKFVLPHTWIVVRIDGKNFHQFTDKHQFSKPNDLCGITLMNVAAECVMKANPAIIMAYGVSDEYSFIIKRYDHRQKDAYSLIAKIVTLFSAAYTSGWTSVFKHQPLLSPPTFDARAVMYPTVSNLRDYMSWRQADCHINNMYNTCFWNLVANKDLSRKDAELHLRGTVSIQKLDILKNDLGIDYSNEPSIYRKGTVMHITANTNEPKIISDHCDIIGDSFWTDRPWLLGKEKQAIPSPVHIEAL